MAVEALPRRFRLPDTNSYPGVCATCGVRIPETEGTFVQQPLRLVCAVCVLVEGAKPNGLEARLAQLPRRLNDGRELTLRNFQIEDARRVEKSRALLLSHQMGCGKCRSGNDMDLINGMLITAEATWSTYASQDRLVHEDGGEWALPSEPLRVASLDAAGKIVQGRVLRLYRQRVKEKLRRITLNDGSVVTITQAHKLYKADRWTNELAPGDRACVPARLPHEQGEFDLELADLFGWMIGDGHENRFTNTNTMVITQKDTRVLERLLQVVLRVADRSALEVHPKIVDHEGNTGRASDIRLNSAQFRAFCEARDYPWATLSAARRVPRPIMQGKAEVVAAFLRSYFDAEGSVLKTGVVEVSSASERLIKEVSVLLRRFGVWLRIKPKLKCATNGKSKEKKVYYYGVIGGASLRRYRDSIGFTVDYKVEALAAACAKKSNTNTEGVPASTVVRQAFEETDLPLSAFGLDPSRGLSSVYLKGTQEFSRESLGVVIGCMDDLISGSYVPASSGARSATVALDCAKLAGHREQLVKLAAQEVHYTKIESVEEVDYDGWVYDLEVADHHNYVAEGVLCHNTVISVEGALRSDMPNWIFTPASVRENWRREVQKWRPEIHVEVIESQSEFRRKVETGELLEPGLVVLGSFGVLPGNPCLGCVNLRTKLKALKKDKRFRGSLGPACQHTGRPRASFVKTEGDDTLRPETHDVHPATIDLKIDGVERRLAFHFKGSIQRWLEESIELPKGHKPPELKLGKHCCDGTDCCQKNPLPKIDRQVLLLADECHAFKTPGVQRTRNWRALREAVWRAGGYVFGLSGTPCEGKPGEFWEVLRSFGLEKAAFGHWDNYYRIFKHWYDNPKGKRLPPDGELRTELHERLRRIQINRRRKDVLDELPPRVEDVIYVEISDKTIKEVNEAVHRMIAVKRAWDDVQATSGINRLQNPFEPRLLPDERVRRRVVYAERVDYYFKERPWNRDVEIVQAVEQSLLYRDQCPAIDELSKIRAMLSQAKVAAVTQWISDREEEEEPVVLFSQHVSILKKIAETRPGWACFHGGLTAKKRQAMVEEFQSGQIQNGLAVSIGAGGEGITLTRAGVAGFIDLAWNPAKVQQAESRLIRIGAERHSKIVVVRFIAKHVVDDLVVKTLKEKESLLTAMEWEEGECA